MSDTTAMKMYLHDGSVDLSDVNGLLRDMADEIERLRGSQWIAIDDRLPQNNTLVFVWFVDSTMENGGCPQIFLYTEGAGLISKYATHWMDLPAPPEDKS